MKAFYLTNSFKLNLSAFSILFIGYFLTVGTKVISAEIWEYAFRVLSFFLILINIAINQKLSNKLILSLILFSLLMSVNLSTLALNIIFLIVAAASLSRLTEKELAVVLMMPVFTVVALHGIFLGAGVLVSEVYIVGDRVRTALGFTNPNQVSVIYLSLAIISYFFYIVFKTKLALGLFFLAIAISLFVLNITDSRTSSAAVYLIILFFILHALFKKIKFFLYCLKASALTAPFLGLIASAYLLGSVGTELDSALSYRPQTFYEFVGSITCLNLVIGWSSATGVDNFYIMLLSASGLIGVFVVIFAVVSRILFMKVEFTVIFTVLMIASVFESFLIRPEIPSSILFAILLFSPMFNVTNKALKNSTTHALNVKPCKSHQREHKDNISEVFAEIPVSNVQSHQH